METNKRRTQEDTVTELRAIVDLVDANVSPVTEAETWEAEIAARRRDGAATPSRTSATIKEVIDLSTALA